MFVMWAVAVPSYVRPHVFLPPGCPNEILSSGTHTSPQEVTDQQGTQTCPLKRHANYPAALAGKHRARQMPLSFLLCSSLCLTTQSESRDRFTLIEGRSSQMGGGFDPPGAELSNLLLTRSEIEPGVHQLD